MEVWGGRARMMASKACVPMVYVPLEAGAPLAAPAPRRPCPSEPLPLEGQGLYRPLPQAPAL